MYFEGQKSHSPATGNSASPWELRLRTKVRTYTWSAFRRQSDSLLWFSLHQHEHLLLRGDLLRRGGSGGRGRPGRGGVRRPPPPAGRPHRLRRLRGSAADLLPPGLRPLRGRGERERKICRLKSTVYAGKSFYKMFWSLDLPKSTQTLLFRNCLPSFTPCNNPLSLLSFCFPPPLRRLAPQSTSTTWTTASRRA